MAGVFKAYDVRGVYPDELDEGLARRIGLAFPHVLEAADRAHGGNRVIVSRDMRVHSEGIAAALMDGLRAGGLDVIDVGLATTPMNYFAIGHLAAAGGVQVTASHNPGRYNGMKFSRHEARPVSGAGGISLMERRIREGDLPEADGRGGLEKDTVTEAYSRHVLAHLDPPGSGRRLRLAADAANGMGTLYRPLLEAMGVDLLPLYFELDGSFPHHEANPLKEENLRDLAGAVRDAGADLGVAFDGDADRAAFVDETGTPVGSDLMTALIAGELLSAHPGRPVVYDLRSSRTVAEYIRERGGTPVRERVGHSFIKATLRARDALFGGELAGHYYFRDNYFADCAILAVVEVLNLLRRSREPLSALVRPLQRYAKTPETNFSVGDKEAAMKALAERFGDGRIDRLDGITVEYPDWWFNVRPSNTEPYLRLVLEASTPEQLAARRDEVVALLGDPV